MFFHLAHDLLINILKGADKAMTGYQNIGNNAERACSIIPGTMCEGVVDGQFVEKFDECASCEFCQQKKDEEGDKFVPALS